MPLIKSSSQNPAPLYIICIEYILPILEHIGSEFVLDEDSKKEGPLDKLGNINFNN